MTVRGPLTLSRSHKGRGDPRCGNVSCETGWKLADASILKQALKTRPASSKLSLVELARRDGVGLVFGVQSRGGSYLLRQLERADDGGEKDGGAVT